MTHGIDERKRWFALVVLCLGVLMIVLGTTIVNATLPSTQADLGFTETSLVWVANAYMLIFGGRLLLGGRLGDLFGHRKLFPLGLTLFTLASAACGLANSQGLLITVRAMQGLDGAVVPAVSLSLIMNLFTSPADRIKAMGIYGFVYAGGGSIGILLGGLLTNTLSWHWIFLVNLPIGVAVYVACVALLPVGKLLADRTKLDVAGAIAVTASLMLAVYAVMHGNEAGWTFTQTLTQLGIAIALMIAFLVIESCVSHPPIPLYMLALRNVATANVVGVLRAATVFMWFLIPALYIQRVLDYSAMQVGLAFLPANIIVAMLSLGLSAKLVMRFGTRVPLSVGLLVAGTGLVLFARTSAGGSFVLDVLPGTLLFDLGAGVAFNSVLLAAISDVAPDESGLASGVVNTSFMMDGALGLTILAGLAAARTEGLVATGADTTMVLNGGYHLVFLPGAIAALPGSALAGVFVHIRAHGPTQAETSSAVPV